MDSIEKKCEEYRKKCEEYRKDMQLYTGILAGLCTIYATVQVIYTVSYLKRIGKQRDRRSSSPSRKGRRK
jgi:hypothetical protein